MNKAELIKRLNDKQYTSNITETKEFVDCIFDEITEELSKGNEVSIHGFGKFVTAIQAGRSGTAPDGTAWTSIDKRIPKFKAATALKDAISA